MTAVEFIVDELNKEMGLISFVTGTEESYKSAIFSIIERAKEMEKEQIVTTWNTAHQAGRFEGKGIAEENWQTFESYWEENFKSE